MRASHGFASVLFLATFFAALAPDARGQEYEMQGLICDPRCHDEGYSGEMGMAAAAYGLAGCYVEDEFQFQARVDLQLSTGCGQEFQSYTIDIGTGNGLLMGFVTATLIAYGQQAGSYVETNCYQYTYAQGVVYVYEWLPCGALLAA